MSDKKLITVFGATGKQGGSVVQTFLNDPQLKSEWSVRGVSRDASSASSQKLVAQGVEMVSVSILHHQHHNLERTRASGRFSNMPAHLKGRYG